MSTITVLPGVLPASVATGLPLYDDAVSKNNGWPSFGLADLLLFSDGAGTSVTNAVSGRASGVIEHPNTPVNNAFSWLPGGGLQIEGTEIVSLAAFDASKPWTLISVGAITGSAGAPGSEKICGIVGFREFATAPIRGAALYARGSNDWNSGAPAPYYQYRPTNAGVNGTTENLLPTAGLNIVGKRCIRALSYDGASTLSGTIYDATGAVIATDSYGSFDPALMFVNDGVTLKTLTPCIGIPSGTYAGGKQQIEAFARYDRLISAADVSRIARAVTTLGANRGRYF